MSIDVLFDSSRRSAAAERRRSEGKKAPCSGKGHPAHQDAARSRDQQIVARVDAKTILCIVETPADLEAIEQAAIYHGMYFVLMGHLSPLDDIGPDQLGINELISLLEREEITEVILATNLTLEGQATADFLLDLVTSRNIKVSRLARGMPMGGELEYMDPGTLDQAFADRKSL